MAKKPILTEYNITAEKLKAPLTIAFISDLHERPDADLLELVKESEPDMILIAGDTLERYDLQSPPAYDNKKRNIFKLIGFNLAYYINYVFVHLFCRKNMPSDEKTYDFLRKISKIAPVYMSVGNHEQKFIDEDFKLFNELGITLLDNSDITVYYKENKLIIGGLSSFYDEEWLSGYEKKDGYKILLSHHPAYFDTLIRDKDIDLTLSGHNHGGQIRIKGKGILSSGEGMPPKYDKGIFENRLIVNAGCSNTVALPRINNPREIVKIKINGQIG